MPIMDLPIDVISKEGQLLRFRWTCPIVNGMRTMCEGSLPASIERAVAELIGLVKDQATTISTLSAELETLRQTRAAVTVKKNKGL